MLVPLAEGGKAHNIVSPWFQGGGASALILYDEETVSPELGPQPPMRISLCAPSQDHWTIVWDTVFPSTIEEYRRLWEQAASKPTKTVRYPQAAPVTELVELRPLPAGNEPFKWPAPSWTRPMPSNFNPWGLGVYQGVGQDVSRDPHGRFFRVQLIVQEDVGKSLVALRSDLLATCSAFVVDIGQVMDVPRPTLG